MLRQKYVAGTHCHPIYAVINLYTVHIDLCKECLVSKHSLQPF